MRSIGNTHLRRIRPARQSNGSAGLGVSPRGYALSPGARQRSFSGLAPSSLRSSVRARSTLRGPSRREPLALNYGPGTVAVPASNPRFARCLTLREGYRKPILKTLGNMFVALGGSNQRGDTGTGPVRDDDQGRAGTFLGEGEGKTSDAT